MSWINNAWELAHRALASVQQLGAIRSSCIQCALADWVPQSSCTVAVLTTGALTHLHLPAGAPLPCWCLTGCELTEGSMTMLQAP